MFDFNKITKEDEKDTVLKFKEHGRGIVMGKFNGNLADKSAALWNDLISNQLYSERVIITRMLDFARTINTSCNDEMIGRADIAFTIETELDEIVEFTYLDMYKFLRAVLRHRRTTSEYRSKKAEMVKLESFISANKTVTEKRREAAKRLSELKSEL